ncbi:MAG: nicotinate (nicotinamide) nucleotide adenylyltransferase [Thermodesulfobacterium geofontis]|uniref:Probable nicotinate-nucleotide adenylyltransferase n=1 Tax=Thermodesulfobacterium geofontis TaxID=1295609 RepID=A0A2N7PP44_9BACT|nr:MAG: nicotinate (nicotinamide) nucleotide adenylyltransferase [Thermodesulfobacterium geofontis]
MDKSELKKIGILGGTFDPPHLAHLRIAEEVREIYQLNKVFFIPAGLPPHKKEVSISSFEDRFEMVKIAIEGNSYFEVLDIEKDIVPSYTLKTLQKLENLYPESEKFLIIGWDSFCEFETWWNYEKLLNYTNIVVVPRRIKSWEEVKTFFYNKIRELWPEEQALKKVFFCETIPFEVSSSLIRNLVKEGRSVRYLVPEKVYFYIKEKGLYK